MRRRLRQIGGGASQQRVIYPVIVVPNVMPATPQREAPGVAPRRPLSAPPPSSRGARGQEPYYYPGRGDRSRSQGRLYYDPETQRIRIRRGGSADEEEVPASADSAAETSPPSPPPEAEEPPQAAPAPVPPRVRRIERAILETGLFQASNINFEFDDSALLPASRQILDAVGEVLARYSALRIAVEGHTDAVGNEAYNERLSQARAETVVRYLAESFNLDSQRLDPVGYGEARPVASNETATGRTLNRRVSFRVLNPEAAEQYLETEEPMGDAGNARSDTTDAAAEERLREIIREAVREGLREQEEGSN